MCNISSLLPLLKLSPSSPPPIHLPHLLLLHGDVGCVRWLDGWWVDIYWSMNKKKKVVRMMMKMVKMMMSSILFFLTSSSSSLHHHHPRSRAKRRTKEEEGRRGCGLWMWMWSSSHLTLPPPFPHLHLWFHFTSLLSFSSMMWHCCYFVVDEVIPSSSPSSPSSLLSSSIPGIRGVVMRGVRWREKEVWEVEMTGEVRLWGWDEDDDEGERGGIEEEDVEMDEMWMRCVWD